MPSSSKPAKASVSPRAKEKLLSQAKFVKSNVILVLHVTTSGRATCSPVTFLKLVNDDRRKKKKLNQY